MYVDYPQTRPFHSLCFCDSNGGHFSHRHHPFFEWEGIYWCPRHRFGFYWFLNWYNFVVVTLSAALLVNITPFVHTFLPSSSSVIHTSYRWLVMYDLGLVSLHPLPFKEKHRLIEPFWYWEAVSFLTMLAHQSCVPGLERVVQVYVEKSKWYRWVPSMLPALSRKIILEQPLHHFLCQWGGRYHSNQYFAVGMEQTLGLFCKYH